MKRLPALTALLVLAVTGLAPAADLSTLPAADLVKLYGRLRDLSDGDGWASVKGVTLRREHAVFTLDEGTLSFAAPVEGRVLAALFEGKGSVVFTPPTPMHKAQMRRAVRDDVLRSEFKSAVFLFTDATGEELNKLVTLQASGNPLKAKAPLAAALKRYAEEYNGWVDNQAKDNPWITNLPARMLADLTEPDAKGFFLAHLRGTDFGDLFYHFCPNRPPVINPFLATDEEVMLLRSNPGTSTEFWCGCHLASEYAAEPHPEHHATRFHCATQAVTADIDKDRHLSATAVMTWETKAPVRLLPLTLEGVLRVTSVKDGEGNPVPFIQEARHLDADLWVVLPKAPEPGKPQTLILTYREDSTETSRVVQTKGCGLYYVTARASWFPGFGVLEDRTRFTLRFTSPKGFRFLATGKLLKSDTSGPQLVTEWDTEVPVPVVGFNFGNFVEKSRGDATLNVTAYTGKDVPDDLKSISASIDAMELEARGTIGDLDGQLGVARGGFSTASMAETAAGMSFQALKIFAYAFGPLPFKEIAVTEQPVIGYGQSWPSLIFLPYDALLPGSVRRSLLQFMGVLETEDTRLFYRTVAVHEMAHQWWGHLVGEKTYHDRWLVEGIAEFSVVLFLEQVEPKKVDAFWQNKREVLLGACPSGGHAVDYGPLWLDVQLDTEKARGISSTLVYNKGAYVLQMLRLLFKDPRSREPDAKFFAMLQDFLTTHRLANASTRDFRRVAEKHFGEPLDWFFEQWVYGKEVPTYDFKYTLEPGPGGKTTLKFSLTQSGVGPAFFMKVPFYAETGGQMRRLGLLSVEGAKTETNAIQLPFKPDRIVLDPYKNVLCTVRQ
ncbi:MAG: hypothetical protein KA419_00680 [Acidobacteria bacterium]|nr:hypothetical protein [Acidobacteriota bacterium]